MSSFLLISNGRVYTADKFMVGDKVIHAGEKRAGVIVGYPEDDEYPVRFDNEPDEVYYCPVDMLVKE